MQSYRFSIPATRPLRRLTPTTVKMPCYVATAPRAPRHAGYHYQHFPGLTAPWATSRGAPASPFADLTSTLQPLFRLFDEELTNAAQTTRAPRQRSFQPRFDVREEEAAFHLQGELPGIDQKDITIEFKDEKTLVVSGRSVRESSRADAEKKPTEQSQESPAKATEGVTASAADAETASETGSNYHQPSVEDEFIDVGAETAPTAQEKGKDTETEVEKPIKSNSETPAPNNKEKYWVSERSVGEFHRSFTFPGHIDQEAVTASLNNGVLNITVPKALQKEPRRIAIE